METQAPPSGQAPLPAQDEVPDPFSDDDLDNLVIVDLAQNNAVLNEIIGRVIREANESFDSWMGRVYEELGRHIPYNGQFAFDNLSKKRKYTQRDDLYQATAQPFWDSMVQQARISFFLHLNDSQTDFVVDHIFQSFPAPTQEIMTWFRDEARKRFKRNISNWKYRALRNMKNHMIKIFEHPNNFIVAGADDILTIHRFLEHTFSEDHFFEIFDCFRDHIDIQRCGDKAKTWAKMIYVEIGTCMKRHLDWQQQGEGRSSQNIFTWDFVSHRFKVVADSSSWAALRPSQDEVKLADRPDRKKPKTAKTIHVDPDDDPGLYIPPVN